MIRKAADHPRKTTVNRRKTALNSRISGSCYRSFRLNGAIFRRNSSPRKGLELSPGVWEFKPNLDNELRPKTTIARTADYRNTFSTNKFGRQIHNSSLEVVAQSITRPPHGSRSRALWHDECIDWCGLTPVRTTIMIDTESRTTTAESPPAPANGNMTALVSGILDDAQKLAKQQIEMLKAEVREDFRRSKRAAEFGGLGVVLLTVGFLGLVMALSYFLHETYQFSLWASWSITGGLFLLVGGALAATSYILLERFNPLPDKTFNALQENLSWKTST